MLETLSTRAQRLTTQTSTKRLFYLCSLLGLVSLVGVCVVILPWHMLYTRGQWLAFSFLAIIAFCWLGSVAAMGRLELDLPRTVKVMAWLLTLTMLAQIGLGLFLEYDFVTHRGPHLDHCLQLDPSATREDCKHRLDSIVIAFPIVVFLLPVLSIPLLYLLLRQSNLLSTSHLYSNLYGDNSSDLPPNWDVQPETFAPDSSASDNDLDDESRLERKSLTGRGSPSPRPNENDEAGRAWFELGKKRGSRSRSGANDSATGARGPRWSEVKRERERKARGRT